MLFLLLYIPPQAKVLQPRSDEQSGAYFCSAQFISLKVLNQDVGELA